MDDFKKITEQLFKIYINAESVNDLGLDNYFDENVIKISWSVYTQKEICKQNLTER